MVGRAGPEGESEVTENVTGADTGRSHAAEGALRRTCSAKAKDGSPCRATPTSSGQCFWHSTEVSREQKLIAAQRGGRVTARKLAELDIPVPDLSTADACREFIQGVVQRGPNRQPPPSI